MMDDRRIAERGMANMKHEPMMDPSISMTASMALFIQQSNNVHIGIRDKYCSPSKQWRLNNLRDDRVDRDRHLKQKKKTIN